MMIVDNNSNATGKKAIGKNQGTPVPVAKTEDNEVAKNESLDKETIEENKRRLLEGKGRGKGPKSPKPLSPKDTKKKKPKAQTNWGPFGRGGGGPSDADLDFGRDPDRTVRGEVEVTDAEKDEVLPNRHLHLGKSAGDSIVLTYTDAAVLLSHL